MKIAVASEGNKVSGHFGHCGEFNIFDVENKKIIDSRQIPSPGHGHGVLPDYLNNLGVNVIISGGMGAGAVNKFRDHKIEVVTGAEGMAEDAVNSYLTGKLVSSGSICQEHNHNAHGGHGHTCTCETK